MKEFYIWRTKDNESHEIFSGAEEEFLSIKEFYRKEWRLNGRPHREDGPAYIWSDESQAWWQNGNLHRTDGPAIICSDGSKEWWQNGNLHRIDGPAIIWPDGIEEYWINGEALQSDALCIIDEYKKEIDRLKQIEIEHNKLKDRLKNIFSV